MMDLQAESRHLFTTPSDLQKPRRLDLRHLETWDILAPMILQRTERLETSNDYRHSETFPASKGIYLGAS
jgi:hypothetical protein